MLPPPFHNRSIKMLAFFSVTLKWRDFVYPRLCLFNILLSGRVSDRLFSRQSLQTASKHSTASSNRTIFNFPLLQCAGKCERNIIMEYDWNDRHNFSESVKVCKHWFLEDLFRTMCKFTITQKITHWWMKTFHFHVANIWKFCY